MPDEAIVFCDESGNSGPNYLEKDQPLYVIAGWLVPLSKLTAADDVVKTALSGTQQSELKSGKLLKTPGGREVVKALIKGMYNLGCVPFYVLAEKRFALSAKMVQTFLDPLYK